MTPRTLSTADERREAVLAAATRVSATRGLHAPTLEVAKSAGISQAYLFRLYPTKADLATALVGRCNDRVYDTFAAAAAQARAGGDDVMQAMGRAYKELLQDRELLLLQLHAHAASAQDPAIRETMRASFGRLVTLVEQESGAPPEQVQGFFAYGMLLNVMAALDAGELDLPWARTLMGDDDDCVPGA